MSTPALSAEVVAVRLLAAEASAREIDPITDSWSDLSVETAYAIQDSSLERRRARGERLVGLKLGLTSRAKQRQMGVAEPLVAWLTDAMAMPAGDPVPLARLIHPRAEPEIAFVLGRDLKGPGVTAAAAMDAVRSVTAAVEVIDSRFRDYRFTLPDVIADNASSCGFLTGPVTRPAAGLDLSLEACLVSLDGQAFHSATGAAVLGHPGEALAHGANLLARRGLKLEAGWLVLTGALTDAVPLRAGSAATFEFTSLGTIAVSGAA